MHIKPIRNEEDYDAALAAIDRRMDALPGSPESDELDVLVTLVEAYEGEHWEIDPRDPVSAIEHVV